MSDKTMIEEAFAEAVQYGARSSYNETIQQHRHPRHARSQDRTHHGGKFAPPERGQELQWLGALAMALHAGSYSFDFSRQCRPRNPGAGSGPVLSRSAEQRERQSGGAGGVP